VATFLRDLLDAEEPLFSHAITQLEKASGHMGADVRLIADITEKAHQSMRELGLDPADTSGKELYHTLDARVAADNARVASVIGASDPDDVEQLIPYMVQAANKVDFNRRVFVLKHEKAKDLLRRMPPRVLMKKLGYENVEALFSGEDFDELYTALRFSEGPEWLEQYNELFKTVTRDDYEERDIRILVMNHAKYVDLAAHFVKKKLHNITHTKELGVIVVVPMHAKRMRGLALKSLPLLLHYLNEVKLYSTFFKSKSHLKNFGEIVVTTLIADPGNASQMAGQYVHWRVIQRYFGKLKNESHLEAFEPHVQPEDLHWRRAEDLLYKIDPQLIFWKDRDYVGLSMGEEIPVSLNLFDVSFAYSNSESYENRYVYHFRESLWNEIFARYMSFPNLEHQILQQLDNDMVAPERLHVKGKK